MNIPLPGLKQPVGSGDIVKKVASSLGIQQKGDCGCAKRQRAMNRMLTFGPATPGSRIVTPVGPTIVTATPAAPNIIIPGQAQPTPPPPYRAGWKDKKPPDAADGWRLIESCNEAALFTNGASWMVWKIAEGKYRSSHSFNHQQRARGEYRTRCDGN